MTNKEVLKILQSAPIRDGFERWQDFCQRYDDWYDNVIEPNIKKVEEELKSEGQQ